MTWAGMVLSGTIVQVPSELLSSGQLAFKEVESVLLSSEREKPGVPIGQIPKLRVPVRMGNNDPDTAVMGTIFPQESANRLLSILAESDDSKAFVLFKTGSNDRNDLCLALGKFLHLAKQESFTITSDCPMDTFLSFYANVVISDYMPKLKTNSGWKIVNLGNAAKSGKIGTRNVNQAIASVYGHSIPTSNTTIAPTETLRAALVFISHSFKDEKLKETLQEALRRKGIETFAAKDSIRLGSSIQEKVRNMILKSDYLVAIYTTANPSGAIEQEVAIAMEHGKKIIPMVETGARPGFMIQSIERVEFGTGSFDSACERVAKEIALSDPR